MWLKHLICIFSVILTSFACSYEYFLPENDYYYKYMVSVESSAVGTTNRKTGSDITCDVHILVTEQCKHMLKVNNCILMDLGEPSADGTSKFVKNAKSEQFSSELSRYAAYFTMSNGSVTAIAFHNDETLVAANFKRGIVSSALTRRHGLKDYYPHKPEIRNDVQGSCNVFYASNSDNKKITKVTMKKEINTCDFPSKPDWHLSPFSLFWNMSLAQTLWINSTANCTFEFSSPVDGGQVRLESTVCKERHARMLESTRKTEISVQTNIKQKLTLNEVSTTKKSPEKDDKKYRSTSIHFEYEKTTVPTKNLPDVDSKIRELVNQIAMDLDKQGDTKIATQFGELIDLLRMTPELDQFAKRITECSLSKECFEPKIAHKMHILIYALVQCHHAHCFRVLRQLAALPKDTRAVVMNDNFLNGVFVALADSEIQDVTFIKEIKEFCAVKPVMKKCVLSLASIVHSLWIEKRDEWSQKTKLPSEIVDVLEFILNLPEAEVVGEGRVLQFKAIGTIGDLLEQFKPDILDWLFKLQVSALDHVPKIEATRRFKSSDALYGKLVSFLRNDSFPQEDRVAAYSILVDKFHNEKLSLELEHLFSSNTTEHNLKMYIFSHLLALSKSTDYASAKFARDLVHKISMNPDSDVTDELETNSKYNEHKFWKTTSLLPKPNNNLGLTLQSTELYDGHDPASFYLKDNVILHLLGQEFSLIDSSIYLQGIDQMRSQVLSYGRADWLIRSSKMYLKKFGVLGFLTDRLPQYVDPTIVQRLKEIHEVYVNKLKPSQPINFLASLRSHGDDSSYFTFKDLVKLIERQYTDFLMPKNFASKSAGELPKTRYVKLVEAVHLVPTLAGIPLNWTVDAYYLSKSELLNTNDDSLKWDFRVGIIASLQNRMLVDIPGFTECGVQSLTTGSLAFNGLLGGSRNEHNDFTINVGLLQQPAYVGFARKNSLIRGNSLESIPDWDIKRVTQDWCSDVLVPSVGLQLCHSKSHAQVTDRPDKPWTLMAGDSHWNYTLRNVNDHRTTYTFQNELVIDERDKKDFKLVMLKKMSEKAEDSPKEKDIFRYFVDEKRQAVDIYIGAQNSTAPHMSFHSTPKDRLKPSQTGGSHATIYISPKIKYEVNFTRTNLGKLFVSTNDTECDCQNWYKTEASITTPTGQVYTADYEFRKTPKLEKVIYSFKYVCGLVPCNTWTKDIFPSDVWDDKGNARLEIREISVIPSRTTFYKSNLIQSYELETPKALYEFKKTKDHHMGVRSFTHWNISKFSLPDHVQRTFLNISYGSSRGSEDGFNVTHYLSTLSVPNMMWGVDYKHKERERQRQTSVTILQNPSEGLLGVPSIYQKEIKGFEFYLIHKDLSAPALDPWTSYKTNVDIYIIFNTIERISYSGQLSRSSLFNWTHDFELAISPMRLNITAETTSTKDDQRFNFLHQTNFTTLAKRLGNINLNVTRVFAEPRNVIHLHNDITIDDIISTSLDLVTGLEPCDVRKNGFGSLLFTVEFPNGPILNSVFKANACTGQKFFEADFQNSFINGRMSGNFEKGITTINSNFTKAVEMEKGVFDMEMKFEYSEDYLKPAVLQVKIPERNKLYYQMFQYYPFSEQFIATACKKEICTDIKNNPYTFISELVYDFSDDDHFYGALTINNEVKESEVFRLLTDIWFITGIPWMVYAAPASSNFDLVEQQLRSVILPRHPLLDSCSILLSPITNYIQKLKNTNWQSTPISRALSSTHIPWLWSYFDGVKITKTFLVQCLEENWQYHEMKIEDGRGTYYFAKRPTLFIIAPDTSLPGITSKTYREYIKYLKRSPDHYEYAEIFHDPGSERLAVLFDNKNVMTFDQQLIKDVRSTYGQCPFLLTSNVRRNQFAIYAHNDDLYLLFPEVHVKIAGNGSVFINASSVAISKHFYWSRTREVRVIQTEDMVHVDSNYGIAVKCVISHHFCIFYTNDENYGNLVGLLGNNNDNPIDDNQPLAQWNLATDKSCLNQMESQNAESSRNISCYDVFGGGYYKNSLIFQGDDVVPSFSFHHEQCEEQHGDPCSTGLAYVVMVAASGIDIQGPLNPCMRCQEHNIGEWWLEKVENVLEVVFVVNDDSEKLRVEDVYKSLQELSTVITKEFAANGFKSIKFGLLSAGSYNVEHKVNSKQLYTSEEFVGETNFNYVNSIEEPRDNDEILAALDQASNYPFDPKAVHVVVLVTSKDEDGESGTEDSQDTLLEFEEKGITFYTISNFPNVPKQSELFGIRSDGHTIPKPKSEDSLVEFPKGLFAKLSSTTRGAVWLLSNLETNSADSKIFDQTFAKELLTKAKQDSQQCRSCVCVAPKRLLPETKCYYVKC